MSTKPANPHFCYEGDCGPDNWANLSPDWQLCATGKAQSPIDIPATAPVHPACLQFTYRPSVLRIVNNGHTVQANFDEGSTFTAEGKTYRLIQVHAHAHSGHTLEGQILPMEAHFVHQAADGSRAVIGVFLQPGPENAAWAPFFEHLPAQESPVATIAGVTLDPGGMLPALQTYYRYDGSLTTPPCSEGISWFVMNQPAEVSPAHIAAFTRLYPNNYRPVQPLNERAFAAF
jgi:carbonic anhydrase